MDQKGRHMLRDLGSPWNFDGGSRWLRIGRVAGTIYLLLNQDLSTIIQIWSGFCNFWLLVLLHFFCAYAVEQVGSLSHIFHSFFQVNITLVFHYLNLWFATLCFADLVYLEERIVDCFCMPVFDWFIQYRISIIVIHDHNIKISPAWLVWESSSEITETLSLDIEIYYGCA